MGCCPNCGGVNTLDLIDGRVYYCRDCEYSRAYDLAGALGRYRPRPPPPATGSSPASLQLLPLLTTPGGEGEHAVLAPSTRGTRGGPCTGGPVTPPRPQPLPTGIPRRRKPFVGVPAAPLAFALLLPLIPLSSASPLPPAHSRDMIPCDDPTFRVSLSFQDPRTNTTTPVPQALANFLFINNTTAEVVENFSVSNGANYTLSDFPGLNLTNVTSALVDGEPPQAYPNATADLLDLENLSSASDVAVNLVWSNGTLPASPPGLNGTLAPPPPAFPLFVKLIGVALFLVFTALLVTGLCKVVGSSREEEDA